MIHHPGRELTNAEIAQQDRLENACHSLVCDLIGEKVPWDIEWIGPIAEEVAMIICETLRLKKYEEFYPYINRWIPSVSMQIEHIQPSAVIPQQIVRFGDYPLCSGK